MQRTPPFVTLILMCLIAFAWKAHPEYSLVVAANRDEWHDRPAAPAAWWSDHPEVLAGRDLQAGGTWLGVTRSGRFAALTNFRDPSDRKTDAPTRGKLVSNFLIGTTSAREYLIALREHAGEFPGFNLLAGDGNSLYYFSSRIGEILAVPPGVHALSNHTLNEPWPKVDKAKSALGAALRVEMPWKTRQRLMFDLLSSKERAPDTDLPDTGVGIEWERMLSPAMIVGERYGTRCSTVLSMARDRSISFVEHSRASNGGVTSEAAVSFVSP
jgi:uncharacterized protein with NRDE domain